MGRPIDLNVITRGVSNDEPGAQVYAASLLSIEVDTPAEKPYMHNLAIELQLNADTVNRRHLLMGLA